MQIVIEISEEDFTLIRIVNNPKILLLAESRAMLAVKNGTPLPEHHGRLGDIDTLEEKILHIMEGDKRTFNNQITDDGLYYDGVYAVLKILKQVPAIIPTTKEGE